MTFLRKTPGQIILEEASKRGQVVYGQRAVNQQLPTYLRKKTKDYDIYSKDPKGAAIKVAELLNREINGDSFEVKRAKYGRTWKVKDKKSGENIVDYTQPSRYPKTKNVLGVKYADLSSVKRKIGKILKDEKSSYRWDKDMDTLSRIKKAEMNVW